MKNLFRDTEFILKEPHQLYNRGRVFPIGTIVHINNSTDVFGESDVVTESGEKVTGYKSMAFYQKFERITNNRNKRKLKIEE